MQCCGRSWRVACGVIVVTMLVSVVSANRTWAKPTQSIAELVKIIKAPENKVDLWERWNAVMAIGRVGTIEAAKVLIGMLDDPRRYSILNQLGATAVTDIGTFAAAATIYLKDKEAVPLLAKRLNHENPLVRVYLCEALGHLGGNAAIAAISQVARKDTYKWVREYAVYSMRFDVARNPLGTVTQTLVNLLSFSELNRVVASTLYRLREPKAAVVVAAALKDKSAKVRELGCNILRRLRNPESVQPLISLLKVEKDNKVQGVALAALAKVAPVNRAAEVTSVFKRFLGGDDKVARAAMRSLIKVWQKGSAAPSSIAARLVVPTVALLSRKESQTRMIAAQLLGELGQPKAAAVLRKRIELEDDGYARKAAIAALARVGRDADIRWLLARADRKSDEQRTIGNAFKGIRNVSAATPLLKACKRGDWLGREAIDALARLRHPKAAAAMISLINDSKMGRRDQSSAADALVVLADPSVLHDIQKLLEQSRNLVVNELSSAYLKAARLSGFKTVLALAQKKLNAKEVQFLTRILNIWSSPATSDEAVLFALAKSKNGDVRAAAYPRVGTFAGANVGKVLCGALGNVKLEEDERKAAAAALANYPTSGRMACLQKALAKVSRKKRLLPEQIVSALRRSTGLRHDEDANAWKKGIDKALGRSISGRIAALDHERREIQLVALHDIATWANASERQRALVSLTKRSEKHMPYVMQLAMSRALAAIGDPVAVHTLARMLEKRPSIEALESITAALNKFNDKRGIDALLKRLDNQRDQQRVMEALAATTKRPLTYRVAWWREHADSL